MGEGIAVALVTGGFAVLVAMLETARRENRRDHGVVGAKLDHLADSHRRIERKIDTHINDHAKGDMT